MIVIARSVAMSAVGKPKIVLLGQKDPTIEIELTPDEGPFESWLAVAQDMWGAGNLTPLDSVFASRAIGTIVPTQGGNFGTLCYQLGHRLFTFSREGGIWIDAFECESALSKLEKRPKDKVKLATWSPETKQLGANRLTHLAVLSPSRLQGSQEKLVLEAAQSLKKDGQLFYADVLYGPKGRPIKGRQQLSRPVDVKYWFECAGLALYSEIDITSDIRLALVRGLHNSLNMLANIRKLREPWRTQRFNAFEKELEEAVRLHVAMEREELVAMGFYYTKA
jgi:hypothetical protein